MSTDSRMASALDTGMKRNVAYGCALRTTVGWQYRVETICRQHPYWCNEVKV